MNVNINPKANNSPIVKALAIWLVPVFIICLVFTISQIAQW